MKKTYTKLVALTGALGMLAFSASAQISGVVTINSGQATGGTNYQSFSALATALNTSGISGPLTVNVVANSGPYTEQPQFNAISGAGSSSRIIINGNGNTLQFNSSNSAQPWTMALNGTDYMTVNNLIMLGQGTTYAMVCVLTNAADNNKFNNCVFQCPVNGTSSYQVPFAITSVINSPSGGSNSGNYNSVTSCTMQNGYYGIFNYGYTSAPYQQGNSFVSNWVTDFYAYGIYYPYQMYCTIKNCTVDRLTRTSSTTTYGFAGWYQQGAMIDGNKIWKLFNSNNNYTGTCYPMYIYYTSVGGGVRNTVRNNIISDIKSTGTIYGMYCYYSNSDIYNNTIDLDYVAGNQTGTIYGMYPYGSVGYSNVISNNLITIRRGGSGTRYGIYIALTGNIALDRNDIVVTSTLASSYLGYYNSAANTLAQWAGQIDNSAMSTDPIYANQAGGDLHPTNAAMDNTATPMGLVFDQENAVRNQTTPDVGALEFLSPICAGTPSANSVTSPTYAICPGEDVTMTLGFLNPALGFTYQWQQSTVSNVGPFTPIAGANGLFYTAPAVTANTWYQIVQTCTLPGGSAISPVGAVQVAGPSSSVVPYYEDFEGIGLANRLPNCSWIATGLGNQNKTYISAQSGNRVPRSGVSYATFDNGSVGTSAYYTNPIAMSTGITYSAAVWWATEYFGYSNWTNLSILVGPNQSTTGLVQVASISPAISGPYKLLSGLFTVPSAGNYYVCIRATSASGSAQYLSIDDISVTVPCYEGGPNTPVVSANASSTLVCAGDAVNLTAAGASSFNWLPVNQTGAAIVDNPVANTTYTVVGNDATTGCDGYATVQVNVNPAPTVFAVANPPVVCAGQPAVLSAISPGSTFMWSNNQSSQNITVNPTTATNFTVIATNALGCTGSFVQAVGVMPNPTISVISSNAGEACKDDQLTLTASGGVTYQWISSSSSNVFQGNPINIQASTSSVFTVTGVGANGCSSKTTLSQSISDCTGIRSAGTLSGVQVYPNPTTGAFTVAFGNNADHTVTVTDVTGRVIMTNSSNNTEVSVDLTALANGIYYVKLQSSTATDVVKVVKQ